MKKTELDTSEIEEVEAIMKRRRLRSIWNKTSTNHLVLMLNQIRQGNIELDEFMPGGVMKYDDYLFELDLLKFVT